MISTYGLVVSGSRGYTRDGLHVPAGIRLDLADGTVCLPDEFRICLLGRKTLYRSTIQAIKLNDQHVVIAVGRPTEVRVGVALPRAKLPGKKRRGMDANCDQRTWQDQLPTSHKLM